MFANDMTAAWRPICSCLGIGLLYTWIFMYMMSCCTWLLTYISILGVEAFLLSGMGSTAYYATTYKDENQGALWGAFAAFLIIWMLFNCMICCSWKRIKVAVAIIDCTADFMVATKRLAIISLFYFIMSIAYFVFWLAACIGVIGLNEITADPTVR